ncbi:MAG: ABC transporter ATP-binding protein [Ardenticatenaceae bacterium]
MNTQAEKPSSFLGILPTLYRSLPLLWGAAPLETTWLAVLLFVQGLVPAFSIWLIKMVVDEVMAIAGGGTGSFPIMGLVALWGAALLVEAMIGPWVLWLVGNLNEKLTAHINLILMRKATTLPDLYAFEDVEFYNNLQLLQKQAASRPVNLVVILVSASRQLVTVSAMLLLVGSLSWWLPFLILAVALPQAKVMLELQGATWKTLVGRSGDSRKMDYLTSISLSDRYAKEVRLFGVGAYLIDIFSNTFDSLHQAMRKVRTKKVLGALPVLALSISGNLFVFWWVVSQALAGQLTAGDVLLLIQALAQLQRNLLDFLENIGFLYERILFFDKLLLFMAYESPMLLKKPPQPVPPSSPSSLTFKNVTFRYPDGKLALEDVSFEIRAGEKVALVGENGAGKSTIVKLVARFYDPTEGEILVDGINLRELDLTAWREKIAAVFQDFGKYHFTVHENIVLGQVERSHSRQQVHFAAKQAGFDEVAEDLPQKYETQLGKPFDGTELSGGQWQKLALARAFIRQEAQLLILDEPTAALDPRSEYDLFLRFAQLTQGKMALMVTHRLASVRMVDRIIVLKRGKLVENGTHAELLALNGEYASLYRMQSELYQNDDSP